jgi:hypothetical protein
VRRHQKVHRLNLELGPQSFRALTRLQAATEASSQAETIRLALQTMEKMVEEARKGSRLIIERADGEKVEIMLPGVHVPAAAVG